jgi:hypothetical protein
MSPGIMGVRMADLPAGRFLWLERRWKTLDDANAPYRDLADLVLFQPGEAYDDPDRLGPEAETPLGRARDVVRSWRDKLPRWCAQERELARLFLKRRR